MGNYTDSSGDIHGFEYNGTTYTTLDVPGSTDTKAWGISNGIISGYYHASASQAYGFTYNGTSYTTINDPASLSTQFLWE